MSLQTSLLPLGRMARQLHVTAEWLRAEADAGRVPCVKAGSRFLFSPAAVERALVERASETMPARAGGGQ
jgi:hypothetical protein